MHFICCANMVSLPKSGNILLVQNGQLYILNNTSVCADILCV